MSSRVAPAGTAVDARGELDREQSSPTTTVLTTEHFTLQGARAATISESTARGALYVGAVSSGLIALGFVGQASRFGASFEAFALVVLPTLFVLGLFTFLRLVQSSVEDILYGRAINRIRGYYRQLIGDDARYLLLSSNDDVYGVLANMGLRRTPRWQLCFTLASMVAVLNAVIAGTTLGLIVGKAARGGLAWALIAGSAAGLGSLSVLAHVQARMHASARESDPAVFPSPSPTAAPADNGGVG